MQWVRAIIPSMKAAGLGSFAGTMVFALIFLGLMVFSEASAGAYVIVILAFIMFAQFICSMVGILLVGLPVTILLKRSALEGRTAYVVAGGLAGGALTLVIPLAAGESVGWELAMFVVPAIVNGATTAWFWWSLVRTRLAFADLDPLLETFE